MIFPSPSQIRSCKSLTWESLLDHRLFLKVFGCCMYYMSVCSQMPASISYTCLTGRQKTHLWLAPRPCCHFCLSGCIPFDQCHSFKLFFLLICTYSVYQVIPGGHTPPAEPQSFPSSNVPSSHLFTWVYWTTVKQLHKQ